jgi:hypothetical protein
MLGQISIAKFTLDLPGLAKEHDVLVAQVSMHGFSIFVDVMVRWKKVSIRVAQTELQTHLEQHTRIPS